MTFVIAAAPGGAARGDEPIDHSPAARAVRERLTQLLSQLPSRTRVGLLVENAATGERWFARGEGEPLKPASVMKLFTTAAAVQRLGADFRFETRVYLHGHELWIVGSGDPGLGDERIATKYGRAALEVFDRWAAALRERALQSIDTLVLDDGIFDRQWRHPDWPDAEHEAWFQAPVGGLNLNDNCLDARVRRGPAGVELVLHPPLPDSFIRNQLTLGSEHSARASRRADSDLFEFGGAVARDAEVNPISVRRPTVFFGQALRTALERQGIAVHGEVVRRALRPEEMAAATLVATHSTSLRDVLWRANTFSQNLFAESLMKALPAYDGAGRRTGEAGSWPRGAEIARSTLADLGLDLRGTVFRDGSGLSHGNRVSAAQVVRLLTMMRRHRDGRVFVESLAVAGEPGTMRRRYADPSLRGRLRGKTGTISGVRALAGYLERADGPPLVFALLVEGPRASSLPEQVCRALVE